MTEQSLNPTYKERLARYIWWTESGRDEDWVRFLDNYRDRAKRILNTPNGWQQDYSRQQRRPEV